MDVTSALTTITAVGELAKLIVSGKVDSEVKAKAAELNNSILSLQGTLFALQSQNHELLESKHSLESKLVEISNWENQAFRYKFHELCPGVFVYTLKENQENSEPSHYICPNCYQEQRKSILTSTGKEHDGTHYLCKNPTCNCKITDYQNYAPYQF